MRLALLIALLLSFSLNCTRDKRDAGAVDDLALPGLDLTQHPNAIRLTNGTVNLVIVPTLGGRIMRYGYVGGPNVLWTNPAARAAAAKVETPPTRPLSVNYGGDKAWPWPQDDWPRLIGRIYPPPPEADQAPYRSRLLGSHAVRLESPPIPSHAARIVREITLDPVGTRVTIVTRLEQASGERPPPSMAAWSVTQTPGDARLYARLLPDGVTKPMNPSPVPATTRPVADRVIAIHPPIPRAAKLGLDADILAAALGNTLFIQRCPTAAIAARSPGYRDAERAQIFCQQADVVPDKNDAARGQAIPRYLELEFTSPRRDLAAGDVPELRVTWELRKASKRWTDEKVGRLLLNDTPEPANMTPPPDVP